MRVIKGLTNAALTCLFVLGGALALLGFFILSGVLGLAVKLDL